MKHIFIESNNGVRSHPLALFVMHAFEHLKVSSYLLLVSPEVLNHPIISRDVYQEYIVYRITIILTSSSSLLSFFGCFNGFFFPPKIILNNYDHKSSNSPCLPDIFHLATPTTKHAPKTTPNHAYTNHARSNHTHWPIDQDGGGCKSMLYLSHSPSFWVSYIENYN